MARTLILALLVSLLAPLSIAEAKEAKEDAPKAELPPDVSDKKAKEAIDRFKREFDTQDLDFQLDAVIKLSKVRNPKVAQFLLKLMKNKEPEIQVEAMKGLGRQHSSAKKLERKLPFWLDEKTFEPRVVAMTIRTIEKLNLRKHEEEIIGLIDSKDDEVAITALKTLGVWRSYKSLKNVLMLWEFYPEEGKWTTGSVTVDTGADTATEQRLAKAKWKAKYGGRVKKARPEVVKAIRLTVNEILGIEDEAKQLKRPPELREWMSENKVLLRKYR
jgi:hypothetical protein